MAEEISACCVEVSDELPEDQQQQGLNDSSITVKHYQTLLEEHQRCGSPQYQEILPCTAVKVTVAQRNAYKPSLAMINY